MAQLDEFGAALKALRVRIQEGGKPLTLQGLERKTGIHYTNLSGYEKEQEWPSRATLERILDGLGASFLDLAAEVDRQQRLARGELPEVQPPPPPPVEFEERMRQVALEVFTSGLKSLLGLPSGDLEVFAASLRAEGIEPGSGASAVIRSALEVLKGRTG